MSDKYYINMSTWHSSRTDHKKCGVCLAGCVMAMELNVQPYESLDPSEIDDYGLMYYRLNAIDDLRNGSINLALRNFYGAAFFMQHIPFEKEWNYPIISVCTYTYDGSEFKEDFLRVISFLKQEDL